MSKKETNLLTKEELKNILSIFFTIPEIKYNKFTNFKLKEDILAGKDEEQINDFKAHIQEINSLVSELEKFYYLEKETDKDNNIEFVLKKL